MKRYIRSSKLVDNQKIQKGLWWDIDGHNHRVTYVDPSHKSCKITETFISEDTREEIKYTETYLIAQDEHDIEYAYSPDYPRFKLYSTSAFNYPDDLSEYIGDDYVEAEDNFTSAYTHDYSPSNPWDAPGMSVSDFI